MLLKLNKNALFTVKFMMVAFLLFVISCENNKNPEHLEIDKKKPAELSAETSSNENIKNLEHLELDKKKPVVELSVETSSKRIYLNKQVAFTITVTNIGQQEIQNAVVVCSLANELEYISSTAGGLLKTESEKTHITWNIDKLPTGNSIEIKLTARGILERPKIVNTFEFTVEKETIKKEISLRISGVGGRPISTYDTEDPVEVGSMTMYVVSIHNEGNDAATGIVLFNDIPEEMEFVKAEGPTDYTYNSEKRRVEFKSYPKLEPWEKLLTYKIVCKAIKPGSAKNTARIRYDQFDREIIDEEGTSVYE